MCSQMSPGIVALCTPENRQNRHSSGEERPEEGAHEDGDEVTCGGSPRAGVCLALSLCQPVVDGLLRHLPSPVGPAFLSRNVPIPEPRIGVWNKVPCCRSGQPGNSRCGTWRESLGTESSSQCD